MHDIKTIYDRLGIDTSRLSEYTTTDICEKYKLASRPALQTWIQAGFVAPSIKQASGKGAAAAWSYGDLVKIKVFKTLIDTGVTRRIASFVAQHIGPYFDFPSEIQKAEKVWFEVYLDGGTLKGSRASIEPPVENRDRASVLVAVNLSKIVAELKV